ncbi:hypothetical protein BDFB_011389 [Asbolus verrucosus]|uniref:Uncharacterized protein n=1 Tax=Asbolus verrucosus TaxID=1661398 RepID=A0A482W9U7_ASBVE|nr:hypothetical protein BDFB_011389 [Asbolus verrucosus]
MKLKVTELLFNDGFVEQLQESLEIQNAICELINTCQDTSTSPADAVNLWLNLDKINAFLFKQADNVGIEGWHKFNTKPGIFKILYDIKISQPLVFWRMAETEYPRLSSLVVT